MTTSDAFRSHIELLARRSEMGCSTSSKSLAAIVLVLEGWRPGDPDPVDVPDDDGGEPVDMREAA